MGKERSSRGDNRSSVVGEVRCRAAVGPLRRAFSSRSKAQRVALLVGVCCFLSRTMSRPSIRQMRRKGQVDDLLERV